MRRCSILALFTVLFVGALVDLKIVLAAGVDKNDKNQNDDGRNDDDRVGEKNIPTSVPIDPTDGKDGQGNGMVTFTTVPASTNSPIMAPMTQQVNDGTTTEDMDEDGEVTVEDEEVKESCRAINRGIAVTTNTSIQVVYNFEILTTTSTPLYTGIAVNTAVTNYLMDQYIKPYCNGVARKNIRTLLRNLYNSRMLENSTLANGDVRGIARGTTKVLDKEPCPVPAADAGVVACHRLQTVNTIYFQNDYTIDTDEDGSLIVDDLESTILSDISAAFADETIQNEVTKGGEAGLQSAKYLSGTTGEITIQGDKKERSYSTNSNGGGLTRAGKAFLTLFILCLLGVIIFFGYKYGYPKLKERYAQASDRPAARENLEHTNPFAAVRERFTQSRGINRSYRNEVERTNPFNALYERFQRKVPNEVSQPYDFVVSESKYGISDKNVLISDTIESSSTDGGMYGTEMILEDLQEEEVRLSPGPSSNASNYRFTPDTLPSTTEYARSRGTKYENDEITRSPKYDNDGNSNGDAFSFSDVNIIIDDSSSYTSTIVAPTKLNYFSDQSKPQKEPKRDYIVPDTVNL